VAVVIEAMIIKELKGKKSLDDFMQLLYKKFYEEMGRGFTSEEFESTLESFIGIDLTSFFEDHVYGTKTIDYEKFFEPLGVDIELTSNASVAFGLSTSEGDGRLLVRFVTANSMAENVGVSPNDEIIAFNGFRVNEETFNKYIGSLQPNQEFNLIISRDEQLMSIDAKMGMVEIARYNFTFDDSNKLGNFWLREKM
jgi:predicted metalloprotease with PDZ domain